jgi:hypothetical protein
LRRNYWLDHQLSNFFDDSEADFLVDNALSITAEGFRLKRSTTGNTVNINIDRSRTSENAFDVSSNVSMILKRRSMELLRYIPFDDTVCDGLQVSVWIHPFLSWYFS